MFVKPDGEYDFEKLLKITKIVTKNLNRVIDVNFYPVVEVIEFIICFFFFIINFKYL